MPLADRRVVVGDDAENIVLNIVKGSDLRFTARYLDSLRALVPIVSVKGQICDDEGNVILASFATVSAIQLDGSVEVAILASQTANYAECEHGSWDFTITTDSAETKTIIQGSVVVEKASG